MPFPSLKSHLSSLLGPEPAALLLGTLLAYPLHDALREKFALLPAAWITTHGHIPDSAIADLIHDLYHPDGLETADFCLNPDNSLEAISRRIAAQPHAPWIHAGLTEAGPYFIAFIKSCCDMGHIPRGVYGTVHHRIERAIPPVIISPIPPPTPDLSTRFLHFHLAPESSSTDHCSLPTRHLHTIPSTLIAAKYWQRDTLRLADRIERTLAAGAPAIPFRRRIQLAIAMATFTISDNHIDSAPAEPEPLLDWVITRQGNLTPPASANLRA